MRKRTLGRESALKVLYQKEMTGDRSDHALRNFFETQPKLDAELREFIQKLVTGVEINATDLDIRMEAVTENWHVKRMAVIDRNILRMAVYEMMQMPETPPKVVINEAVNLAKKYSQEKSGKFVNGLLDKLMRRIASGSVPEAQPPGSVNSSSAPEAQPPTSVT